ncbi:MFS transporter [Kitasatospora cineracea]|uniref:MFS transporter n=1 Tax=Kitasatospora cineracea TaxID=88074 RepID=UPI0036873544
MGLTGNARAVGGGSAVEDGAPAAGGPAARGRWRRGPLARLLPETAEQRALAAGSFVNSLGAGMFMTSSVLYFTRIVGLPMAQVATGLFCGAMAGLAAGLVAGRIADRWGARETQIAVMLVGAATVACYLVVRTFWPYLLVSVLLGVVFAAGKSSQAPLVRSFGGENPTVFRAYLRSSTNLAIALGALIAGIGIQLDSAPAYLCLVGGRAVGFAGSALALLRLPRPAPLPVPGGRRRWEALRDRPYLTATVLNSLMSLHYAVPTFLLPLWVVDHTAAPRWMVSGALLLNTVLVIGLQVRVSRGVDDTGAAGTRMRYAGAAVLAGLVMMAGASGRSAWVAVALLLAAVAVYTFGELWHAAASMEYSFGLAAPHAQGEYSGVFGLGAGVAEALAPAVLGALALTWGPPGFLALGLGFLAVGAGCRPLIARSLHKAAEAAAPTTREA